MRNWPAIALVSLCGAALAGCGNSNDAATIYVIAPSQKAVRFTQDLAFIAKRHGLSSNLGSSTDDHGYTYRVIDANGHWLRLWSTNVPLDRYANPVSCGHYSEGHPDPGQYIVTIDHGLGEIGLNYALAAIARGKPRALISQISEELKASGYSVRSDPVECSPLSKAEAPRSQ